MLDSANDFRNNLVRKTVLFCTNSRFRVNIQRNKRNEDLQFIYGRNLFYCDLSQTPKFHHFGIRNMV